MTDQRQQDFARLALLVARDRDRAAFAQLFDHFAPRLKSYLLRLGQDSAQAEELAQEVMVVLWQKADLFDATKSSLATWLFRIARNRRIDAMRRDRSHLIDPDDPIFLPEAPPAPDSGLDQQRRDERIGVAMRELPPEQLDLVRQAFFLGLTHSQIAEQSGMPLGTVKSRIRLAFARLRKALESDPEVDTDA